MSFRNLQAVAEYTRQAPLTRGHFLSAPSMRFFDSRMSSRLHVVTDTPDAFHAFGVVSNRYRDHQDARNDGDREYGVIDIRIDLVKDTADIDYAEGYRHTTARQAHASAETHRQLHLARASALRIQ